MLQMLESNDINKPNIELVGNLDKCLFKKEILTEEYEQLRIKVKNQQRKKFIVVFLAFVLTILITALMCFEELPLVIVFAIIFYGCIEFFVRSKDYEYYKKGLDFYISDKAGSYLQVCETLKNNKVRKVTFRVADKDNDTEKYDVVFFFENNYGFISKAELKSVTARQSIKEEYRNKIELNMEKNFEITYYFYDKLPIV